MTNFNCNYRNYTNNPNSGQNHSLSANSNYLFLIIKSTFIYPIISSIVELGSSRPRIFQAPIAKTNLLLFRRELFRKFFFSLVGFNKSDLLKFLLQKSNSFGFYGKVRFSTNLF